MHFIRIIVRMICVKIDKTLELVTYSTFIKVDNKIVSLVTKRCLQYAKSYELDHSLPLPEELQKEKKTLFELIFYWPKEYYTDKNLGKLPYFAITEDNCANDAARELWGKFRNFTPYFNYPSKPYDFTTTAYKIYWQELSVDFWPHRKAIRLTNTRGDWQTRAIPPNGFDTVRYDCITPENVYVYDCDPNKIKGILITLEPNDQKISYCLSAI